MQKKIIALAVAALASTAAFAQTNVTVYGSIDAGIAHRFDSQTGDLSRTSVDGGQSAGNRIGFKGTEDLGNGLKAIFTLEQGFQGDNGADHAGNPGLVFSRQAFVGLTGGFGTAIAGRLYTPHFSFVSALDPFAAGTVGRYSNVYGGTEGNALFDPVRVDNAVAYVSPNFGGFDVTLAYSNAAAGNEDLGDNAVNNTVYAVLGKYAAGSFMVGMNYHMINFGNTTSVSLGADNLQNVTLGGSYDAKVVKVSGLISYSALDNQVGKDTTVTNYMLGVVAPFGKNSVKASYIYSDGNKSFGENAQMIAVGYDYALSKRTNFYSAYSYIDNDNGRAGNVGDAANNGGFAGTAPTVTTVGSGNAFQQGVQVGIRHQF
jgi:predicted porin